MSSRPVVEIGHDIARSGEMEDKNEINLPQGSIPEEEREDDESSIEALQWGDFDEEEMELAKELAAKEYPDPVQDQDNQVVPPSDIPVVNPTSEIDIMERSEASSYGSEDDKASIVLAPVEDEKVIEEAEVFDFPCDIRDDEEDQGDDEEEGKDNSGHGEEEAANTSCSYLTADNNVSACGSSVLSDDKASNAPVLDDGPIWSPGPKMYRFHENRTFNQKLTFGVLISVVLAVGIGVGNLVAYNEYESDDFRPVEHFQCSGPIQDPRTSSEESSHAPIHHGFPSSTRIKSEIDMNDNDAHVPKKILENYNRQTETLEYVVQSIDKLSKKFDHFENTTKQLSGILVMNDEARKYGRKRSDRVKAGGEVNIKNSERHSVVQPIADKTTQVFEANPASEEVTITSEPFESSVRPKRSPSPTTSVNTQVPETQPSPIASIDNARAAQLSASVGPQLQEAISLTIPQAAKPQKQYREKSKLTKQKAVDVEERQPQESRPTPPGNRNPKIKPEKQRKSKIEGNSGEKILRSEKYQREKKQAKDYRPREATPQREYKPKEKSPPREYKLKEKSPPREYKPKEKSPPREYKPKEKSPLREYKPKEKSPERQYKEKSPPRDYKPRGKSPEREYRPSSKDMVKERKMKNKTPAPENLQNSAPVGPDTPRPFEREEYAKKSDNEVYPEKFNKQMKKRQDEQRQKKTKKNNEKENKKYSKNDSDMQSSDNDDAVNRDSADDSFDWSSYRAKTREDRRLHQHWNSEFERHNWQFERDRVREKVRRGGDQQPSNLDNKFNSRTKIR